MLATKTRKTFDDYMQLPEEFRAELIEGEYYMAPSPDSSHQRAVVRFVVLLDALVRQNRLGTIFIAPFDAVLSEDTVVQPDVLFVAAANLGRIKKRLHGAPDLVIEVLSPTNAERDRIVKRDLYARFGVAEYWLADPETRSIEMLVLEGDRYRLHGILQPGDALCSPMLGDLGASVDEAFE